MTYRPLMRAMASSRPGRASQLRRTSRDGWQLRNGLGERCMHKLIMVGHVIAFVVYFS